MKDTESLLWLGTPTASTKVRSAEYRDGRAPNPAEYARLFPTPTAADVKRDCLSERSRRTPHLESAAKLFPTPTAADARAGEIIGKQDVYRTNSAGTLRKINRNGIEGSVGLAKVVKLLPTPTAQDARNATLPESQAGRDSIPGYLLREMYATPQARDYRTGQAERWDDPDRSRNLNDQVGGSLNPDWVEWLMGFPRGWTDKKAAGGLPPYMDGRSQWDEEPSDLPRLAKGVPDRAARIKANGNAVVPQQAYPIFAAIAQLSGNPGQLK